LSETPFKSLAVKWHHYKQSVIYNPHSNIHLADKKKCHILWGSHLRPILAGKNLG